MSQAPPEPLSIANMHTYIAIIRKTWIIISGRVMVLKGTQITSFSDPRLKGWIYRASFDAM